VKESEEGVLSDAGAREFIIAIEGLAERTQAGAARARYCASLPPGTPLTLVLHGLAVVVLHDGCEIGTLPAAQTWVAEHLTAGRRLHCVVFAVETGGVLRKRAKCVEVEIAIDQDASLAAAALRAASDFTTSGAAALRAASDFTTSGARRAGGALIEGGGAGIRASGRLATSVGDGLAEYAVRKPARLVGQGLYSAADMAGRPFRAAGRLVRNIFLAVVAILVLVLAIVVIWRLPSLPGFGSSPPAIFSPR
jgi:hypothetical protein